MKAIITTTRGIRLVGTSPETKSYIIALNVPLKDIDSELLTKLYEDEICAAECKDYWHIIIDRDKVKTIEFVD